MKRDFVIETYHHIILRGARGMDILLDTQDWWDCNKLLYYQNDSVFIRNWKRDISKEELFGRPEYWPPRNPLIEILVYCLHSNHIHLLVKEIKEGGISDFMRRFPKSLTLGYNKKYGGSGSIFQGPYQSRIIEGDDDLLNLSFYIMVKNLFERYPGGLKKALNNFEDAFKWGKEDPFSSFPDYAGNRESPIIEKDILKDVFPSANSFYKGAKNYAKLLKEELNF